MATKHKEPVWLCTKIHHKSVEPGNSQRNWEDEVGNISISCDPKGSVYPTCSATCFFLGPHPSIHIHGVMSSKKFSQYLATLTHLFTNSHFTTVHVHTKVTNEPNPDNAHHVLLPLLQWPSPTLVSVDPICGHTLKLITWNLCTSHLRYCLSHA